MKTQLSSLAKSLSGVVEKINPNGASAAAARAAFFNSIKENLDAEHTEILERKSERERKKEESERLQQEAFKEEERKKAEEEAQRKKEEAVRQKKDAEQREKEKLKKIEMDMELTRKKALIKNMGRDVENMATEEIAKLDANALAMEAEQKKQKEADDKVRRLKEQARKLDYVTRAQRIEASMR